MLQSSHQSHKSIVEQFAEAVSGHQADKLDKFLEADVHKTINSKVVYKNIQEAQDYYSKDNTTQWKIIDIPEDDPDDDMLDTRVMHNNKIYKASYTFGSSGKISRIDAVPEH
jgi:hypothetical protein